MITYLGSVSIGTLIPVLTAAQAAAVTQLQGQLAGLLNVSAALAVKPPSLAASITAAAQVAAALAVAVDGPTVSLQITALAALITSIRAQLAVLLAIPLGTAGLELFVYDGPTSQCGTEIQGAIGAGLPGGNAIDHCDALVIATRETASWAALGACMKVS